MDQARHNRILSTSQQLIKRSDSLIDQADALMTLAGTLLQKQSERPRPHFNAPQAMFFA